MRQQLLAGAFVLAGTLLAGCGHPYGRLLCAIRPAGAALCSGRSRARAGIRVDPGLLGFARQQLGVGGRTLDASAAPTCRMGGPGVAQGRPGLAIPSGPLALAGSVLLAYTHGSDWERRR